MAKTLVGVVSSDKTDKTIVVTVQTRKTHPLYRKQYTVTTKFMAHDEKNEAQVGDKVTIVETRPLSARKRYALQEILEKPALRASDRVEQQPQTAAVTETAPSESAEK
jgi:small subunit ribosomal protein S17